MTWQGWGSLGLLLGALLVVSFVVLPAKPEQPTSGQLTIFIASVVVLIGLLVVVSYLKGPRPKWRWGKSESDNPDEDF